MPLVSPVSGAALVLAGQLSPPVRVHQLLTGFQTGTLSLVADAVTAAILLAYLYGRMRLRHKGREWSNWRTATFVAGIVAIFLATGSGIASYDDSSFVMHVVQHLLLMNVAPILLGLGGPITLALQASGRSTQTRILEVLHSRVVETITFPVVTAAMTYVTMLAYFLTPIYTLSEQHPLLHDYFHLHFLVAGCLYWWPVVGIDPSRWRMSYPVRLAYLATGIPINAMIGIALTLNHASIDPAVHTLADTHTGGAILWGISELLLLAGIAVMYVQWSRWDAREAARYDRRLERELASNPDRGLAGGIIMDPRTGLWHYPADQTPSATGPQT